MLQPNELTVLVRQSPAVVEKLRRFPFDSRGSRSNNIGPGISRRHPCLIARAPALPYTYLHHRHATGSVAISKYACSG